MATTRREASRGASIEDLARSVAGPVLTPVDPGFEEAAACFNLAVVHRPDVVVGATSAADVATAVRWAAMRDLSVHVQATGHGATVPIQGGVLITTSRMQGLRIDPHARLATIEAGVRWRKVIDEAAPFGLAPLSGSSSSVGAIGYTLGGGLPVLGRTFGYASDRAVAFDLVTADGELRHVTPDDGELFWALRGGKPNVGIVTALTTELLELTAFYGGSIFYDGRHAASLLRAYAAWSPGLPEAISTSLAFSRRPDAPGVPEPLRGRFSVQLTVAFVGDAADGEALVRPMREAAPAVLDLVGPMPYTDVDHVHYDPEHPLPLAHGTTVVEALTPGAADALLAEAGSDATTPLLMVQLRHLGGALARRAAPDAVDLRAAGVPGLLRGRARARRRRGGGGGHRPGLRRPGAVRDGLDVRQHARSRPLGGGPPPSLGARHGRCPRRPQGAARPRPPLPVRPLGLALAAWVSIGQVRRRSGARAKGDPVGRDAEPSPRRTRRSSPPYCCPGRGCCLLEGLAARCVAARVRLRL
ncbi:MAG: hypothetical protein KatS3mg065_1128 [Chloroflexota bacterium]|nr:MAG: hypothetical protein KatS3mg065_1128 [Chloroflexota bacterium]